MAQPVTAILSRQGELAAKARNFTKDANEAGLLVGKVVSRALDAFQDGAADEVADEVIVQTMRRDLDRMIAQLRRAKH